MSDNAFFGALERLDADAIKQLSQNGPDLVRQTMQSDRFSSMLWRACRNFCPATVGSEAAAAHGKRWAQTLQALADLGADFSAIEQQAATSLAAHGGSLEQLRWIAGRGWLSHLAHHPDSPRSPNHHCGSDGLGALLRADPSQETLNLLIQAGVAGGPDCMVSATDCAVLGHWSGAQTLLAQGFGWGRCRVGGQAMAMMGWDPIPALIARFVESPRRPGEIASMQSELERLLALGARLDPQDRFQSNPLYPLLGGGASRQGKASMDMIRALGPRLLELGACAQSDWVYTRALDIFHESRENQSALDPHAIWSWLRASGFDVAKAEPARLFLRCCLSMLESNGLTMAQELADGGARADQIPKDSAISPVHEALSRGRLALMWKLASLGAPLDYVRPDGETALHHLAGEKSSTALLETFLARPEILALVEAPSARAGRLGERALHRACGAQSARAIKLLLDAGADPNAQDAQGHTPLRYALRKYGAQAQKRVDPLLKMLLAAGADPSIADKKGRTPAQATCAKASMPALERLLSLRPQDIASDDQTARQARDALAKRGASGMSLAERVELGAVSCPAPTPRKRSGL